MNPTVDFDSGWSGPATVPHPHHHDMSDSRAATIDYKLFTGFASKALFFGRSHLPSILFCLLVVLQICSRSFFLMKKRHSAKNYLPKIDQSNFKSNSDSKLRYTLAHTKGRRQLLINGTENEGSLFQMHSAAFNARTRPRTVASYIVHWRRIDLVLNKTQLFANVAPSRRKLRWLRLAIVKVLITSLERLQ